MNFLGVVIVSPFCIQHFVRAFFGGVEIMLEITVKSEAKKMFAEILDDTTTRRCRDERVLGFDH